MKFSDNFTSEYIGDKVQAARYDYNICSGPYMFTSYDENSYAYTLTKNPNFPGNFGGTDSKYRNCYRKIYTTGYYDGSVKDRCC